MDRKHPLSDETWRGISRSKARTETERQAKPILADDPRPAARLRAKHSRRCQGRCLAGAGLPSELVGLDWMKRGTGNGYVNIEPERGIVVRLQRSKSSQDQAVEIIVPCSDMLTACFWLEAWANTAKLEAGQPVFRAIDQHQIIAADRLTDRSVSRIVKARVRALAIQVRGAIAEFDKAMTVAKLRGARDRIRKERGKCEGRKSFAEMDAEDKTDLVAQAKRLHRASPKTGERRSLRQIAKELANALVDGPAA